MTSKDYRNLLTCFRNNFVISPAKMNVRERMAMCDKLGLKIGMDDNDIKNVCKNIFNLIEGIDVGEKPPCQHVDKTPQEAPPVKEPKICLFSIDEPVKKKIKIKVVEVKNNDDDDVNVNDDDDDDPVLVFRGKKYKPDHLDFLHYNKIIQNILSIEKTIQEASDYKLTKAEIRAYENDIKKLFSRLKRYEFKCV